MSGNQKYRTMQYALDKQGIITHIMKNGKKDYSFIINGEIIKNFKQRKSINKRIIKLFNTI